MISYNSFIKYLSASSYLKVGAVYFTSSTYSCIDSLGDLKTIFLFVNGPLYYKIMVRIRIKKPFMVRHVACTATEFYFIADLTSLDYKSYTHLVSEMQKVNSIRC